MNRLILMVTTLIFLTSCSEIKTTDPEMAYKYWSGSGAPNDIELLKGQYWQSAHWTKEYIVFLKLKATEEWWTEFTSQNQLQITNIKIESLEAPEWFAPPMNSIMYSRNNHFDQGSRYFRDTLTDECYIYEIQF